MNHLRADLDSGWGNLYFRVGQGRSALSSPLSRSSRDRRHLANPVNLSDVIRSAQDATQIRAPPPKARLGVSVVAADSDVHDLQVGRRNATPVSGTRRSPDRAGDCRHGLDRQSSVRRQLQDLTMFAMTAHDGGVWVVGSHAEVLRHGPDPPRGSTAPAAVIGHGAAADEGSPLASAIGA